MIYGRNDCKMKKMLMVVSLVLLMGCNQGETQVNDEWLNDVDLIQKVNIFSTNFINGNGYDDEEAVQTFENLISNIKELDVDVENENVSHYRSIMVEHANNLEEGLKNEDRELISESVDKLNNIKNSYNEFIVSNLRNDCD